ncbi:MAG: hypothetical protein IKO75_12210 [Bacteroidales bacterium]|nr:hypothetical protein [Bacteroidales bacterium]
MRDVSGSGGRPNGMVQLLFETLSLSGAFVKATALAVACLWPDWGREFIIGGWCSTGVRGAGKRYGRGDWMVRRETGGWFGRPQMVIGYGLLVIEKDVRNNGGGWWLRRAGSPKS